MAEALFNWAVMLATAAVFVLIAWWSYRDLQGMGGSKAPTPRTGDYGSPAYAFSPTDSEEPEEAGRLLKVEYHRNGRSEHVQWVTDERPGYIGTEALPGMGGGILVRHVRITHDGSRFTLENRHQSQALSWRADQGRSGEILPGETLPLEEEVDLLLGDWTITCREES